MKSYNIFYYLGAIFASMLFMGISQYESKSWLISGCIMLVLNLVAEYLHHSYKHEAFSVGRLAIGVALSAVTIGLCTTML